MKKLITILTIMIVLVGAVFATDEVKTDANGVASIDVKAVIEAKAPRYSLFAGTGNDAVASGDTVASHTSTQVDMTSTISASLIASTSAVTVNFQIKQTQASNLTATYKLKVTANDLILTRRSGANADLATDYDRLDTEKFVCVDKTPAIKGIDLTIDANDYYKSGDVKIAKLTKSENELTVAYEGAFALGENNAAVQIANFDVQWTGNPLAVAGTYNADVILEVTAQ